MCEAALGNGENPDVFEVVDLKSLLNNDGISYALDVLDGDLDGAGMTLPAEVLPRSNCEVWLCGIRFLFPDKEDEHLNNITLARATVPVPKAQYSQAHFLGCIDDGDQGEEVVLEYEDGAAGRSFLGLTACRAPLAGRFGEVKAITYDEMHFRPGDWHCLDVEGACGIWVQTIGVDPSRVSKYILMPDSPGMHVFALTLTRPAGVHSSGS